MTTLLNRLIVLRRVRFNSLVVWTILFAYFLALCGLTRWSIKQSLVQSYEFCGTTGSDQLNHLANDERRVRRSPTDDNNNSQTQTQIQYLARRTRRQFRGGGSHQAAVGNHHDQNSNNFERPAVKNSRVGGVGGNNQLTSQSTSTTTTTSEPPKMRTIETAVFIDQALDAKFNGLSNGLVELNKLVLTIMNQVQYLFEYSSLLVPIRLKLVLIEHLKESERQVGLAMPNSERGDIDAYLSNFCNWQQARLARENRLWWDHAILLSG